MTPFQESLQGSIPALMTTLKKDLTIDQEAMRKTACRLIDNGSKGVVVLGTSGEFAGINDNQREDAIRAVVDEIGDQVPVIVGCGQPNVQRTHEQAKAAADLG
ncbi:MAG: dihydrodipicolinate synthase family protein, partial [Candidatus Latescibacteria bacterium]|nr:dihydrodipicolinate synthase family protein [Candidatus Latescibacterota bacterium]